MVQLKHTYNFSLTGCYLKSKSSLLMSSYTEFTGSTDFFAALSKDAVWDKWTWSKIKQWP
jgi:hypothetical protein